MLEYVATALKEERLGRTWAFTVRRTPDDIVVGTSRFLDIDYWNVQAPGDGESNLRQELRPRAVEIGGTWYAESAQRTVVNTNTKLLLLSYAFETWVVERVSFKTDHRNWRSRQAIERLGATFEGIRRAHQLAPDGMIRDSAYFSILRSEWPAIREGLQCRLAK